MSAQCSRFVQNAWKKELCSNCFKPREEHAGVEETFRLNIVKASTNLKIDSLKLQSILRSRKVCQRDQRKKNVAFPESLTEIIGYGGDDSLSEGDDDEDDVDPGRGESCPGAEDDVTPDSEEERALGNLTRANTNFNTIAANLTETIASDEPAKSTTTPPAVATKTFASLMLGRIQKDADGRKTTLLVSVTPFGGDESVPTAKRPGDRKVVNGFPGPIKSKANDRTSNDCKSEVMLKSARKIDAETRKEEKSEHQQASGLEKIVDMPLITSMTSMSVIQRAESPERNGHVERNVEVSQKSLDFVKTDKKMPAIARSPAIKKPDYEKPRIAVQPTQNGLKSEFDTIAKMVKKFPEYSRLERDSSSSSKEVELSLTPLSKIESDESAESDRSMLPRGKDVNKLTVIGAECKKPLAREDVASSQLRKPQCDSFEARYKFEESREMAGEPDGKADEEHLAEPPALPKSPPPIETRASSLLRASETIGKLATSNGDSRPAFHGEGKTKPVVPQKPTNFSGKAKSLTTSDVGSPTKKVENGCLTSASITRPIEIAETATTQDPEEDSLQEKSKFAEAESCLSVFMEASQVCETTRVQASLQDCRRSPNAMTEPTPDKSSGKVVNESEPTFNLTRDQPPDGGETNDPQDPDEDASDVLTGMAAELIRSPNKRRMAPRPPPAEILEDSTPAVSLFARNPGANLKSDSPVVREKEKRERASSCSPKFREAVRETTEQNVAPTVDPTSRRTISLSQDSLANPPEAKEEKKRSRSRFSLKRFLRMGTKKDVDMTSHVGNSKTDEIPSTPQPKPRLEIIHPLELDGAAVEVVGNDRLAKSGEDQVDSVGSRVDTGKSGRSSQATGPHHPTGRPGKPPPPPRNQSLEDWSRLESASKPVRPPPPRVDGKLPARADKSSAKSTSWQPSGSTANTAAAAAAAPAAAAAAANSASDSIYANLAAEDVTGEVRSALAPTKPQRTASMRDQTGSNQPQLVKRHPTTVNATSPTHAAKANAKSDDDNDDDDDDDAHGQDYETPTSDSSTSHDSHAYECLSSSPECDSSLELRHGPAGSHQHVAKRKSDSSAITDHAGGEFKFQQQPFLRSASLPYCGSETESELYAPYGFYTGEEGAEEDQDWKGKEEEAKISRLRQRRGRSIVHRSLEDNYGAVVVANHEALAQFLEQVNQAPQIPGCLRGLKAANPRFRDFKVDGESAVTIGKRVFYSATWNDQNVTLCVAFDLAMHVSRKEFYLAPIVEFIDTVSKDIAEGITVPVNKSTEATISVLPRLRVSTIHAYGVGTRDTRDEGTAREASFVLLQLVSALKSLQARGIEDAPRSLSNVVLCRDDKAACYRLYLLQGLNTDTSDKGDEEQVSLCQCALIALQQLCLSGRLPVIQELLIREKAVSLSQVKSVLEFSLWGPSDLTLGASRDREITLQRWLDLERATVLHALVRTRTPLTVTDEYQLLFLVRTSSKIMCEASQLLDEQRRRLAIVS